MCFILALVIALLWSTPESVAREPETIRILFRPSLSAMQLYYPDRAKEARQFDARRELREGHVAIEMPDGVIVGWQPESWSRSSRPSKRGHFEDDSRWAEEGARPGSLFPVFAVTLEVKGDQLQKLKAAILRMNQGSFDYQLPDFSRADSEGKNSYFPPGAWNCVTAAKHVLEEAGIHSMSDVLPEAGDMCGFVKKAKALAAPWSLRPGQNPSRNLAAYGAEEPSLCARFISFLRSSF